MYDRLETNIPHFLMQYSDKPFPPNTQLFPKHETVTQYLEEYADDLRHLIHFQTQVLDVRLESPEDQGSWLVTSQDLGSGRVTNVRYDAVVVASGHYNVPYVPDIKGIAAWNKQYPGVMSHSKFYRKPEQFKDRVSSFIIKAFRLFPLFYLTNATQLFVQHGLLHIHKP